MGKKKRQKFEDDGRTISNMNVEGMPWYTPGASQTTKQESNKNESIKLTRKEKSAMMRGVLAASLLVALIFILVFTLFILFCVFVWFK